MKIKLSVIILNYNTADLLKACLSAVLASQGFGGQDLEVIVVDNNSSDESDSVIAKFKNKNFLPANATHQALQAGKFKITTVKNKQNLGFAAGNNIGIRKAKSEYILLLNSDTLVEPDALIKVLKAMENDGSVGAATCLLQTADGKIDPASHRGFPTLRNAVCYFLGLEKLFPQTRFFGGYHQGWKNLKVPHEVDCISAAFMMVPEEVIKKVGLLDERFFMYGEDIDWCLRIKNAGFKIFFFPGAKTLHLKRQSGREQDKDEDLRIKTQNMFMDSMWQFYEKHYFSKYPLFLNWLVKIGIRARKLL